MSTNTNSFFQYIEAYHDALLEFACDQKAIIEKKKLWSDNDRFYWSFYDTCVNMISDGVDLSKKQKAIIERQMTSLNVRIPRSRDFSFSISIHVLIKDGEREQYFDKADLGDFYLLLQNRTDISEEYQKAFENNLHFENFHTKKNNFPGMNS